MFQQNALISEMPKLRKFALRLTKKAHNAEDLLQSTMLRALEKNEHFLEETNLFSWTSKIMFNLFVSGYRQKKKFETQYDPEPYINKMSVEPSQEAYVDLITVNNSMKLLSAEHRDILFMVCIKGMSYEETSNKLQVPVGTVRSRLSRARNHLQDLLNSTSETRYILPAHIPPAHARLAA